jgi:hypothetical protein
MNGQIDMHFTLNEKRNIKIFIDILKVAIYYNPSITININQNGWMIMQF